MSNSWRKVLKLRTIGTIRTNNDYLYKSISLRNCPVCPDCPRFSKYIRNLNSCRKVLKSRTIGTKRTQMFLSGKFNYLNRIDFSLELSALSRLSAFSKIYQKFEFLEKSFEIRDKRDKWDKLNYLRKLKELRLRHASLTIYAARSGRSRKI